MAKAIDFQSVKDFQPINGEGYQFSKRQKMIDIQLMNGEGNRLSIDERRKLALN